MAKQILGPVSRSWTTRRDEKRRRIEQVKPWMKGSILPKEKILEALESLIVSGDRIVLEGDNQKQADFLSRSLVKVDAKRLHDLHLIISSISRPEHLTHTCLLHRGGFAALNTAQTGAAAVFVAGGTATVQGWELLQRLDRDLLALNASPGGSADLFAATLFLDFIANPPSTEN